MRTVTQHYANHLSPVYAWMSGGFDAAIEAGATEIDALHLPSAGGSSVVDLGAGFGMHAIPLARKGARVTAIDTSVELLRSLSEAGGDLPIRVINDDLLAFQKHLTETPSAILCMGDTITHLPDHRAVESLIGHVAAELPDGGLFIVSLRDYTVPLTGDQRFIPVRSDDSCVFTCFLEYEPETVVVHDILHRRAPEGWRTQVSHYRKLRLAPEQLMAGLESNGFEVRREAGIKGMVRLVAQKSQCRGPLVVC